MNDNSIVQLEAVSARRQGTPIRSGFSPRDAVTVLFKRWLLACGLFVVIVGGVTAWSFLTPPVYECDASLLVKRGRADVPVTPKESSLLLINEVREEDLNTEIFILQSPELLTDVVTGLRDEGVPPPEALQEVGFEDTVLHLQGALEITALTGSNIIEIAYRSSDPAWATLVVDQLTERYLDRRSQVFTSPKAASFFQEQEAEARVRLERTEAKLRTFLEQGGLTMVRGAQGVESLAAQKQGLLDRIAELEGRRENAAADAEERSKEIASLQARLDTMPERLASPNRMMLDATVEELQRGLVELELERDKLTQIYAPQNAKVRDVNRQIELLGQRLETAKAGASDLNLTEPNPMYDNLKTQLVLAEAEYERLLSRAVSTDDLIVQHRSRLAEMSQQAVTLERLEREVDSAEEAFLLYEDKHEEARISTAMDQERIVNVSVVQPARMPLRPVAPRKKRNVALAIVVGSMAAIGAAFLRERLSPTLTTGYELEQQLGVVELASIPEIR